jgi:hypothetical protein
MAKVNQSKSLGQTYYEIEADEREEVEDMINRIERSYHPLGYGTRFDRIEQRSDGSWIVRGQRANSCD